MNNNHKSTIDNRVAAIAEETKILFAQDDMIKIANTLKLQGYTVEIIKTSPNVVHYVIFYKSENEIYGIESSDTFKLDDEVRDLPNKYFYVGHFGKYDGRYSLWYVTFVLNANEIIENLEKIFEPYLDRWKYDPNNRNEFEKWKIKKGFYSVEQLK